MRIRQLLLCLIILSVATSVQAFSRIVECPKLLKGVPVQVSDGEVVDGWVVSLYPKDPINEPIKYYSVESQPFDSVAKTRLVCYFKSASNVTGSFSKEVATSNCTANMDNFTFKCKMRIFS